MNQRGWTARQIGWCAVATALVLTTPAPSKTSPPQQSPAAPNMVQFFDAARHRSVLVALYGYRYGARARPLALISHGYGGKATNYGFIAAALVRRGFLVASIQHVAVPGDPPMASGGDLAELRQPVWQIGADTIGFVARQLRASGMADPRARMVLVGHSNGGDMTMLFGTQHPERVAAALSLDNRRMPLPRVARPRICSARSSDQPSDPGVLPDPAEQARLGTVIASVPVAHGDMDDRATEAQRSAILRVLNDCLRGVSLRGR